MFAETTQDISEQLSAMWCAFMHDSPMWPIHGRYQCRTCGRYFPVQWADAGKAELDTPSPCFRPAVLPLLVIMAMLVPANVHAANPPIVAPSDRAAMAFARYITAQTQTVPWNVESIEIDASLPRMKTHGTLRAIRHLLLGRPQYQVLDFEGDKTVRQQVILRYLSAQVHAAAFPASSVAVTPVNYKFSYKGSGEIAGATAYSFAIKPRKKREGLIKGELWIDGDTGAVVRQSGYLVKNPSIFVKRVTLTWETDMHGGLAVERITHVSVETRLVGPAELIIHERPYIDPSGGPAPGVERH